jgi:hypothetical protein
MLIRKTARKNKNETFLRVFDKISNNLKIFAVLIFSEMLYADAA